MKIDIRQLQSELKMAKADGAARECEDLALLIQHREVPGSVDACVLFAASNRQSQRRFQSKIRNTRHGYPRIRQGATLRHPGAVGPGLVVLDPLGVEVTIVAHRGAGYVDNSHKDDLWVGTLADGTSRTLGRSQMYVKAPLATAGPDTEALLRASLAIEAAIAFLATLDAFVAEDASEADYGAARASLDAALALLA